MSEAPTGTQERRPPPYHQHRHGHHSLLHHPLGGHHRQMDYRIPAIEKYAYCLCLHVKPTTIFTAAFKLIHAFLYVANILNAELNHHLESLNDHLSHGSNYNGGDVGYRSSAVAIEIVTQVVVASASSVGIYAVMSGRAALLMPLYSVLLIDFFFALPSFYGRDMDSGLAPEGVISMKNYSASNNDQYNRYSIFISTLFMVLKIYFLCVIWKCYRYLRLIQLVGQMCSQMPSPIVRVLRLEDGAQDISPSHSAAPPPYDSVASTTKPPNYEDAIKSSNVYTIDVQSHNSQLPNYSSLKPTCDQEECHENNSI